MEQKSVFYPIFLYGNIFKELFAKVRKIFETQGSFDDLISTLDRRLSGCPLCPIHPEFITSFDRDTPRLIFEWPGLRNASRIFENGVGPSGCPVASPRKRPTSFRGSICFDRLHQGSTGCIGVHRWKRWSIVDGDGSGWVGTLRLLGRMGEDGSIIHITNSVLNFRRVFMARLVRLRTRRRDSPSLIRAISSPYCIK